MFGLKSNKYEYFQPLEVVSRGSEAQPQVVVNIMGLQPLQMFYSSSAVIDFRRQNLMSIRVHLRAERAKNS